MVYPFAYITLTLPLAVGRVAAMTGKNVSLVYLVVAGTMMASCGVIDVILYMNTRKALVKTSVGMKSNKKYGIELTKLQSRRRKARDVIRMEGLGVSEDNSEVRGSQVPRGTIVVSKSVTRSEDSFGNTANANPAISRSESLTSLVEKEERRNKSWLT